MTYLFQCRECKQIVFVEAPIGSSPQLPGKCDCGGTLYRKYTPLGVSYNCSGFYATDKALYNTESTDA